jgi:hypothetical protein
MMVTTGPSEQLMDRSADGLATVFIVVSRRDGREGAASRAEARRRGRP